MKKVFCLMLALCMLALIPVATAEVYSERALPLLTVTGEAQVLLAAERTWVRTRRRVSSVIIPNEGVFRFRVSSA